LRAPAQRECIEKRKENMRKRMRGRREEKKKEERSCGISGIRRTRGERKGTWKLGRKRKEKKNLYAILL